MGQRIDQLLPYGSPVYAILESDIYEVSKNSGTVEDPIYEADGSRQITMGQLRDFLNYSGVGSGLHFSGGKTKLGGDLTEDVFINGAFDFTLSNLSQFGAYLNESANIVVSTENFSNQLNILAGSIALTYHNNDNGAEAFFTGNDNNLALYWRGALGDYSSVKMNALGLGVDTLGGDDDLAAYLRNDFLTDFRTVQFQDKDGTLAYLDDLDSYLPVTNLTGGKYSYNYTGGGILSTQSFGDTFNSSVTKTGNFKTEINQEFNRIRLAMFEDPDTGFSGEVGLFDSYARMAAYNPTKSHSLTIDPTSIQFKRVDGGNFVLTFDLGLLTGSYKASLPNKIGDQIFAMQSDITAAVGAYVPLDGSVTMTGLLTLSGAPTSPLHAATKAYADSLVIGLLDDRGNYTPVGGNYPSTGGSGTAGAILKGDLYTVAGLGTGVTATVGTKIVSDGDSIRALTNSPGITTDADWAIAENNFGYTPLNSALASAQVYVGNASGIGTARTLTLSATSGTFALSNTGVFTFPNATASARGFFTTTFGDNRYVTLSNTSSVSMTNTGANVFNRTGFFAYSDVALSGTKTTVLQNQANTNTFLWSYSDSSNSDSAAIQHSANQFNVTANTVAAGSYYIISNEDFFEVYGDITGGGNQYKFQVNSTGIVLNNLATIDALSLNVPNTYILPDKMGNPDYFAMISDIPSLAGYVTSVTGTTNRITSSGGATPAIDISSAYVGQASITTLGTITTGTWNGSVVGPTYGGTGVNNGAKTITLGGNLTTSGAFTTTFTTTGNTNVTLPTTGTLIANSGGSTNQVAVFNSGTLGGINGFTFTGSANLTVPGALNASGTGGGGYLTLLGQSARPAAVSTTGRVYMSSVNEIASVRRNNANSADVYREWVWPDANTTITVPTPGTGGADVMAVLGTAQTFTQSQTYSTSGVSALFVTSSTTTNPVNIKGGTANSYASIGFQNLMSVQGGAIGYGNGSVANAAFANKMFVFGSNLDIVFSSINTGSPGVTLLSANAGLSFALGVGQIFKTGTNARVGSSTLAAGTVTVANTGVTANTKVKIQLVSTSGTLGVMYIYTVNPGVGFTITSVTAAGLTQTLDLSTLDWYLTEFI